MLNSSDLPLRERNRNCWKGTLQTYGRFNADSGWTQAPPCIGQLPTFRNALLFMTNGLSDVGIFAEDISLFLRRLGRRFLLVVTRAVDLVLSSFLIDFIGVFQQPLRMHVTGQIRSFTA